MAHLLPDENDMATAYNTIADVVQFLGAVVFVGSSKMIKELPQVCPICGCMKDYGHSEKCELHKMVLHSSELEAALRSALNTFGRMEATLVDQQPENASEVKE